MDLDVDRWWQVRGDGVVKELAQLYKNSLNINGELT